MNLIDTFPQPGGFFSGKLPDDLSHLMRWRMIAMPEAVLNGANWEARLRFTAAGNHGLVLNCRGAFIDPRTGQPPTWRPLESRLWQAASRLGSLGAVESHPWGTIQRFIWGLYPFQQVVAHELAAVTAQYGCRFIFLDEPAKEDAPHLARTLRLYAGLVGGKPLPVVTNGTFGPADAPGVVSGRFWQDLPNFYPETAVADTPEGYFGWMHGTPAHGMTPEYLACLASIMGGPYFYTPTNGPFSYDWIPEPFAPGSFGKALGERWQAGDILSRQFEHAAVTVNVSRDRWATREDSTTLAPLGVEVTWKAAPVAQEVKS